MRMKLNLPFFSARASCSALRRFTLLCTLSASLFRPFRVLHSSRARVLSHYQQQFSLATHFFSRHRPPVSFSAFDCPTRVPLTPLYPFQSPTFPRSRVPSSVPIFFSSQPSMPLPILFPYACYFHTQKTPTNTIRLHSCRRNASGRLGE